VIYVAEGEVALLKDYSQDIDKLQKGIAKAYSAQPWVLNLPGKSVACKIDPHYYLAIMPGFIEKLGRWGGMLPKNVLAGLIKTGNLITKAPERDPNMSVGVSWGTGVYRMQVAFVEADFIDRGLKTYAGLPSVLNVSELKISAEDRDAVEAFFEGKTPPQGLVYF
jgi:hypothetical protein